MDDDFSTRGVTVQFDVALGMWQDLMGVAGAGITIHLPEADPRDSSLAIEGL